MNGWMNGGLSHTFPRQAIHMINGWNDGSVTNIFCSNYLPVIFGMQALSEDGESWLEWICTETDVEYWVAPLWLYSVVRWLIWSSCALQLSAQL